MKSAELRNKFLDFMKGKGHAIVPSSSLVPENDPTVLFTTAGMQPFAPFFMGERHPAGNRIADVQKCLRTDDIEEVGDTTHHTFFEMLGNWSFGDYFKEESIAWSFEFLTSKDWLGLSKDRLAVSVFKGDNDAPFDEDAKKIWISLGFSEKRIKALSKKDNWWGPAGETGPCGPDTEIFYWTDEETAPEEFDPEDKRWVEVWNNVFMQFNKKSDGKIEPLAQKNVDTGMGLERTLAVFNGFNDNYQTDLFSPILEKISELSGKKYDDHKKEFRIIADHAKAAVFILSDSAEIVPSNTKQGYVLRRLIRRAIRYGKQLGIEKPNWLKELANAVKEIYTDAYLEISERFDFICEELDKEEEKFEKTLELGIKEFEKIKGNISGKQAFDLYQTYGFPFEMTLELAVENNLPVDKKEFESELQKHQELSRTASAGMFKGGLADAGEIATKYHTATHLLLAGLRKTLGENVFQKGSNINAERLRFDFSYPEKMTDEQIKTVEEFVNNAVKAGLPVSQEEMSLEEAKAKGAMGVFENKYGEKVKVYTIGSSTGQVLSMEICGGPHVENTAEIGNFKIIKEEAVASGIRRIKAVIEK